MRRTVRRAAERCDVEVIASERRPRVDLIDGRHPTASVMPLAAVSPSQKALERGTDRDRRSPRSGRPAAPSA
jgi:hypothetical protein